MIAAADPYMSKVFYSKKVGVFAQKINIEHLSSKRAGPRQGVPAKTAMGAEQL